MSKQMKQNKVSKPRASKKGCEDKHYETVVEAVDEPVVEPYTIIIHDPELKKAIEDRKAEEEAVQSVLESSEVQILLEEPVACPVEEEYIAKYSPCNTKVLNPNSGRYVACDGPIAKKLNLLRK